MRLLLAFSILCCLAFLACEPAEAPAEQPEETTQTEADKVKRGEYLVTIAGCHDCHSPKKMGPMGPEPDMDLALSGHPSSETLAAIDTAGAKGWVLMNMGVTAFVGPWGASFAANLTSDETGIGNWTEEQFFRALREGKYKGLPDGRPLLPPMPWPGVAKMSDEDLSAVFAYLKSTKPIKNVVPAPIAPDKLTAVQ